MRWRSFELDPSAPPERTDSAVEHLAAKYHVAHDEAQAMHDRMAEVGALEGLVFRFGIARPGNTFSAHRVLHLAADRGCQNAVEERLMAAYFTEGEPIGDADTLTRLAGQAGLDAVEVKQTLAGDAYAEAVRADQAQARRLGISGVPFFVIDRRYGVLGAQPSGLLLEALEKAWDDSHPLTIVGAPDDIACDDGGCAV